MLQQPIKISFRMTEQRRVIKASLNEVELLFCKSKCYLHPTKSKADNIPGFLTLGRGPNDSNNDVLVSFVTELQLNKNETKVYQEADLAELSNDLENLGLGSGSSRRQSTRIYIVKKLGSTSLTGSNFSVPISYIYSIHVRTPLVGWWYGSITLHMKDGLKLPTVFFHDDESLSSIKKQQIRNKQFDPFGEDGELVWGGLEFIQLLSKVAAVQKSTYEPNVLLINPDPNDLRNFAPVQQSRSKNNDSGKVFVFPDLNKMIANTKWKLLETVATFTTKAKNQVLDAVEERAPPQVKQLINKPEVQKIGNDFDSARVYLAKWASQVKDEAEQAQKKYMLDDEIYAKINRELGISTERSEILTGQEISETSRRNPITKVEWESFFDHSGRLILTTDEVKYRIFHGGLDQEIRHIAWLFLLGVFPWDSSHEERLVLKESYRTAYDELKAKWSTDEEKRQSDHWKDQRQRIAKDLHRTDRSLPIFASQSEEPSAISEEQAADEEEDEEMVLDNANLRKMQEILFTYNEYNPNLGYVQGMTDLLSPLYANIKEETLVFWAFAKFMERMERNFVRDQSGMKKQMSDLNKLLQFMLPKLFIHLEHCESTDLFFFFRLLLVWFKREFDWDDVQRLWEIFWTDYYSSQFHLFFALSVLSDNERIIRENLDRFDEVLKYMNDLSMSMELNPLMIRAELLFLRFKRMLDIIDRTNSDRNTATAHPDTHISVSPELRTLLSKKLVIQKESPPTSPSDYN